MRALCIDDSINTCDCCGKTGLKHTVAMARNDGTVVHYGSVCAARNSGKTAKIINSEIRTASEQALREARDEYKATPEYMAVEARFAERPRTMIGREAADFVREARMAASAVLATVAAKYRVNPYQI